jgi:hypothetical protein
MFSSVLASEQIQAIHVMDTVLEHRATLNSVIATGVSTHVITFTCPLPDEMKQSIKDTMGLDLFAVESVPMRWIIGDSREHVDVAPGTFDNTYLIYLNSSEGSFICDQFSCPIQEGIGIRFNEHVSHQTIETGSTPRLLIGPMNEHGHPVGAPISYFNSEADALAYNNMIGSSGYTIDTFNGITAWRIASNSWGTSPQNVTYYTGQTLDTNGGYILYPSAPCLLEGTTVLCQINGVDQELPIEQIRPGTVIKTAEDGYRRVELIGRSTLHNSGSVDRSQNRLYVCRMDQYPELKKDLYLTGCHSILVNQLTSEQFVQTRNMLGDIFITGQKYRLMACIDQRAEPWASEGDYTVWHLALENHYPRANYGIFVNGGLLVESCSLQYLRNHSNMELVL